MGLAVITRALLALAALTLAGHLTARLAAFVGFILLGGFFIQISPLRAPLPRHFGEYIRSFWPPYAFRDRAASDNSVAWLVVCAVANALAVAFF
jgi:hypothetical protein